MPVSCPNIKTMASGGTPIRNAYTPFLKGCKARLESQGSATVYGANHPGDGSVTKYAIFKQTVAGNRAFTAPSTVVPHQHVGSAVPAADQLRNILLVDGAPVLHARADQAAASGTFVVAAGGGTAVGDATLSIKGTSASALVAGSTLLSLASSGANTNTILVGDRITVAGDPTVYRAGSTTTTLNGTTEVLVSITPPLQQAHVAGAAVTIATSDDRTVIVTPAPAIGAKVEWLALAASDVSQFNGGALTPERPYEIDVTEFMFSAAATAHITRLGR